MNLNTFFVILIVLGSFAIVQSANILFFTLLATYSHRLAIWPLAERLASVGHNVTFASTLTNKNPNPLIRDFVAPAAEKYMLDFVGDFDINFRLNGTSETYFFGKSSQVAYVVCDLFLSDPDTLHWVNSSAFDLVLIDVAYNDCGYGLAFKFKAPVIIYGTVSTIAHWSETFGFSPENLPEMRYHAQPERNERTFYEEILTVLQPITAHYKRINTFFPALEKVLRNRLDLKDMPPIEQLERETRLVLYNGHYSFEYPRSYPPMFISTPGMHVKTVHKPLPQFIHNFLQDQEFIYISLGSAVVSSKMPSAFRDIFFNVIRRNSQFKFIWRWTGNVPENVPRNLLLHAWLPQQDILANSKIRGFITQAGLPSLQEALYNQVPVLCFPIFGDQDYNADRVAHFGLGLNLEIATLTETQFHSALNDLVTNPKFKQKNKLHSELFKDQQNKAVDTALWWTEFVLRHGNNTKLLQSVGMKETWWERRSLHIWAFLLTSMLTIGICIIVLSVLILKCVWARLHSSADRMTKHLSVIVTKEKSS